MNDKNTKKLAHFHLLSHRTIQQMRVLTTITIEMGISLGNIDKGYIVDGRLHALMVL